MQHAPLMGRGQARAELAGYILRFGPRQAADTPEEGDKSSPSTYSMTMKRSPSSSEVVGAADVWVGNLPRNPNLMIEALQGGFIRDQMFGKELERHRLLELQIVGPIDRAHAAFPQRSEDAVASGQDGSGGKGVFVTPRPDGWGGAFAEVSTEASSVRLVSEGKGSRSVMVPANASGCARTIVCGRARSGMRRRLSRRLRHVKGCGAEIPDPMGAAGSSGSSAAAKLPATAPALAPARSSTRALGFVLPEDEVVSVREEGDDAGDAPRRGHGGRFA